MILFILQNAYTSEKHQFKNEKEWSRELQRSHSGKRLSEMIPENVEYRVINASPEIGDNANSIYKADTTHIKRLVKKFSPKVIVACGTIAQAGCELLGLSYISAPHPAWRQLSKEITSEIKRQIEKEF